MSAYEHALLEAVDFIEQQREQPNTKLFKSMLEKLRVSSENVYAHAIAQCVKDIEGHMDETGPEEIAPDDMASLNRHSAPTVMPGGRGRLSNEGRMGKGDDLPDQELFFHVIRLLAGARANNLNPTPQRVKRTSDGPEASVSRLTGAKGGGR